MGLARVLTVLFAAVLGVGVVPAVAVSAPVGGGAGTEFVGAVTLITGDHVSVRRAGARLLPTVEPGAGRAQMQFAVTQVDDQLLVVPRDAWGTLNAGRLDRRLFDV